MDTRRTIARIGIVLVAATVVAPALGQRSDEPERRSRWNALLNVDLMVTTYTRFLSRKYDLTPEQDAYTQALLRERANAFLEANRPEVTGLLDQLMDARTGGDITPDELVDWGRRVMPIYQEAKREIIEGNNEWREILTEEQKAIHDEDLRLMYESFDKTEHQLRRIVTGEMPVEEFRRPFRQRGDNNFKRDRAPVVQRAPAQEPEGGMDVASRTNDGSTVARAAGTAADARSADGEADQRNEAAERAERIARLRALARQREQAGADGGNARSDARNVRRTGRTSGGNADNFETKWEQYTRAFIEKYDLNEGQKQSALSILKDCKAQGNRYLASRKGRFEELEQKMSNLTSMEDAKRRGEEMRKLAEARQKLNEPLDRIFENQLKPRLERIPTVAQRRAAAEKKDRKPNG